MRINARKLLTCSLVFALAFASSCGKSGNSSKVKIEISPENPIVIGTDLKLTEEDGQEETITAPWFLATFKITNNTDKVLSVLVISMESQGSSGTATTKVEFTQDEELDANGDETFGQLFYVLPNSTRNFTGYFGGHAKADNTSLQVSTVFTGWFSDPSTTGNPEDNRLNPNEEFEKSFNFTAR